VGRRNPFARRAAPGSFEIKKFISQFASGGQVGREGGGTVRERERERERQQRELVSRQGDAFR
jgi:hypothetical protein